MMALVDLHAGNQAYSVGMEAGDRIIDVNGIDCDMKASREIRDLVHIGRIVRYSPSLGEYPCISMHVSMYV